MTSNNFERLIETMKSEAKVIWRWSGFWTFCHHGTLIGATIASAGAGIVNEADLDNSLATILAAIAALLTTLSGVLRFREKWAATRYTSSKLQALVVDAEAPNADEIHIRNRYKTIWEDHNKQIVGSVD